MILAVSTVEDFDRFWNNFSTKGVEKRKQHGSKCAHVFRDPNDDSNRVFALFDWDEEGYRSLESDPDVPSLTEESGHKAPAQVAEFVGKTDA